MAKDAEFRARRTAEKKAYAREYLAKRQALDPEFQRRAAERLKRKLEKLDPAFKARERKRKTAYQLAHQAKRRATDPLYRERRNAYQREYYRKRRAADADFREYRRACRAALKGGV